MASPTIVIIGAGQAGLQVAASLRELGFDGRVVLIGDEPHPPYQRPPLSKGYLLGDVGDAELMLRPSAFFSTRAVELVTGKRARAIDRERRAVELEDGATIDYDHLVLATGARNRALPVPGADLQNVLFLRTLDEAIALKARSAAAQSAVVIGAGFVGLEFAASAAKQGKRVTVLDVADRPLARAVSRVMSDVCAREHEKLGVRLRMRTQVQRLHGERGLVTAVETADGAMLAADVVVVGIGVAPNVELAASCGLTVGDGIIVDACLRTSDPHISAIGDVALHPSGHAGGAPVRIESVQNALDQARCVAACLVGRRAPYEALPWFWSHQGPLHLQMAGLRSSDCDDTVRGDTASTAFSVYSFRAGRLVCVESLNRPADHMLARRLLASRAPVTREQAADPQFDLKSLLARVT